MLTTISVVPGQLISVAVGIMGVAGSKTWLNFIDPKLVASNIGFIWS